MCRFREPTIQERLAKPHYVIESLESRPRSVKPVPYPPGYALPVPSEKEREKTRAILQRMKEQKHHSLSGASALSGRKAQ